MASLLIGERLDDDGEPRRTWLEIDAGAAELTLSDGGTTAALPARVVAVVMRRYGRELDPSVAASAERHPVADLGTLERLRFRAQVDADGRDYLVWREPGRPPLAALSIQVAAALRFLARTGESTWAG